MKDYYWEIDDCYIDVLSGDCLKRLKKLKRNSVDSIVTDPPYELGFMGKHWDKNSHAHSVELWEECLRVLKPGGYLLAFAATRTYHRLAVAIEDAGFIIKDQIAWVYGSGFPKGQNISKAIDKYYGKKQKVVGIRKHPTLKDTSKIDEKANAAHGNNKWKREWELTEAYTKKAKQWDGWNTALKPALEPIVMAQKSLSEKTIVKNILKWGTGALNVDACRIQANSSFDDPRLNGKGSWSTANMAKNVYGDRFKGKEVTSSNKGRWPANFIYDGSSQVVELFPHSKSGAMKTSMKRKSQNKIYGDLKTNIKITQNDVEASEGSAARFFYCAKANKLDRVQSKHPTVKPIKLKRYLTRLVTPHQGIVLDPFAGTGTTAYAAMLEGFDSIIIEREEEYIRDIVRRFKLHQQKKK